MGFVAASLVAALATAPSGAFADGPGGAPVAAPADATLVVSGTATVSREPDLARVDAEIVTNDDSATRSAGRNASIYAALKARLAARGLVGSAIRTSSFGATFVPHPARALPPEMPAQRYGFVSTRSLAIAVTPIGAVGKVVDASLAAGVTSVGDVAFELSDRAGAYRDALGLAFSTARATAVALVRGSEVRVVRVREIVAGEPPFASPRRIDGLQMRAAAATVDPPTTLEPSGPIDVVARVTVTYVVR
ncbi:MAG: hypothetical protein NVSMB21_21330 [Vulcanimicrobiaceae bacterium]